jgi:hypothetical protein
MLPRGLQGTQGMLLGARIDEAESHRYARLGAGWGCPRWSDGPDLCAVCNNDTGRKYNPSYVAFVKGCESLARPEAAGMMATVGVVNRPLVAKQALVSLIAAGLIR